MSDLTSPPVAMLPLRGMKAFQASWKPILFNWLLPGAGYWLIKEKLRAKVLFGIWVCFGVLAMLQLHVGAQDGVAGGVFVFQLEPFQWMPNLGALASLGVGPIYGLFAALFGGVGSEPVRNLTQEYGATYLLVAGLLNWLCSFDLFDRTTHRWFWRLPVDEREALMPKKEGEEKSENCKSGSCCGCQ